MNNFNTKSLFSASGFCLSRQFDGMKKPRQIAEAIRRDFRTICWTGRAVLFAGKRQHGNMPDPLDGDGQFSLVSGTVAGHPLGQNLATLGNEFTKFADVFILDVFDFVGAELADFTPGSPRPHAAAFLITEIAVAAAFHVSHIGSLLSN
jgi:hypothetical protein